MAQQDSTQAEQVERIAREGMGWSRGRWDSSDEGCDRSRTYVVTPGGVLIWLRTGREWHPFTDTNAATQVLDTLAVRGWVVVVHRLRDGYTATGTPYDADGRLAGWPHQAVGDSFAEVVCALTLAVLDASSLPPPVMRSKGDDSVSDTPVDPSRIPDAPEPPANWVGATACAWEAGWEEGYLAASLRAPVDPVQGEETLDQVVRFAREVVADPNARGYGTPGNVQMLASAVQRLSSSTVQPEPERPESPEFQEVDELHFLAEQVFQRREARGETQMELAEAIRWDVPRLAYVEAGRTQARAAQVRDLIRLAHHFGCTVADLFRPLGATPSAAHRDTQGGSE